MQSRKLVSLVILGSGESAPRGAEIAQELGCDLWTLNGNRRAGATLHFQIHDPDAQTPNGEYDSEKIKESVRQLPDDLPIIVQGQRSFAPNTITWPQARYERHFGFDRGTLSIGQGALIRQYLSNTLAYMLAYAIMQGCYDVVYIYGVEARTENREETLTEHPCIAFYIGWGAARGMCFVISPTSRLLATGHDGWRGQYGLEYGPNPSPVVFKYSQKRTLLPDPRKD